MSDDSTSAAPETADAEQTEQVKPTETVDFWKTKAREQEKRAKDNATAAKRLAEIEDEQKSAEQKAADRIARAESEVASVPAKVAEALREHLVDLHEIGEEEAEVFLTASDPALLLKQVKLLLKRKPEETPPAGVYVPQTGHSPSAPALNSNALEDALRKKLGIA